MSLNHTPFESRTSQKAPFAPRATIGGSTTLRGQDFSPATYNSLSDPHLNPYFARKFGKSASLRETGLSRTKVLEHSTVVIVTSNCDKHEITIKKTVSSLIHISVLKQLCTSMAWELAINFL